MISLLLDAEGIVALPFVIFLATFVGIMIAAASKSKAKNQQNSSQQTQTPQRYGQRDYAAEAARKKQQATKHENKHSHVGTTVVSKQDGHVHLGEEEELYDEIVGSLGENSDEGCSDLDGVRLIAHDLAYETEDGSRDYSEVAKIVVLGDAINNPRFKSHYRTK
ncbi:MAG: hypothetical protein ACI4QL_03995 [Candidatus Fimimonas sp.]